VRTFRIDHIVEQPEILNQIAVSPPEDYSPAHFSKCVFHMFDTNQPEEVQLQCHVSTMKYLIDNSGMDVKTEAIDEDSFRANVLVCTSSTFYRWIFGFNGKIKILGPEAVKTAYWEMLQKALYEELIAARCSIFCAPAFRYPPLTSSSRGFMMSLTERFVPLSIERNCDHEENELGDDGTYHFLR